MSKKKATLKFPRVMEYNDGENKLRFEGVCEVEEIRPGFIQRWIDRGAEEVKLEEKKPVEAKPEEKPEEEKPEEKPVEEKPKRRSRRSTKKEE